MRARLKAKIVIDNYKDQTQSPTAVFYGAPAIVVLHNPREKYWGILRDINAAGVFMRCLELSAVDDWARAVVQDETFIGFTDQFFPMWRVERLTLDERSGEIPSLAEQFEARTNRRINEFL